ncbi:MAG: cellulose synthase operon protein YhjQ/BcsQ [Thermoguttaceae bacterium]
MTALDQALIKAFAQQGTAKPAAASRSTSPGLKSASSTSKPRTSKTKPSLKTAKPSARVKADKLRTHRIRKTKKSAIAHRRTKTPAKLSSPHTDGLWAALEKSPKASLTKTTKTKPTVKKTTEQSTAAPSLVFEASSPMPPPAQTSAEVRDAQENRSAELAPRPDNVAFDLSPSARPLGPTVENSHSILPAADEPECKPAWQVDRFTWPTVCRRLIAEASEELDRLTDVLLATRNEGQNVLAICGGRRGEGATTLLLCLARRLAERGIRAALVDADGNRPRLARRLGVEPQFGWDETLDDSTASFDRAMVEATANHLALLPLRGGAEPRMQWTRDPSSLSRVLRTLRSHYDIVLVDLGPLDALDGAPQGTSGMIDGALLVHNPQTTSEESLEESQNRLAALGIPVMGLLENFVPEPAATE